MTNVGFSSGVRLGRVLGECEWGIYHIIQSKLEHFTISPQSVTSHVFYCFIKLNSFWSLMNSYLPCAGITLAICNTKSFSDGISDGELVVQVPGNDGSIDSCSLSAALGAWDRQSTTSYAFMTNIAILWK